VKEEGDTRVAKGERAAAKNGQWGNEVIGQAWDARSANAEGGPEGEQRSRE